MKHLGKMLTGIVAALASVAMAFALAPAALAADATTNSLTVNNTGETPHTFELYQIFTGDLKDGTLSNVQWGSGVTKDGQTDLGTASNKAESLKEETDAIAFGKEVDQYLTNPTTSTKVAAGGSYKFDNLSAGYYLVKDKDDSQQTSEAGKNSVYTRYIIQVVGAVNQDTKLSVPSVEKKVQEKNDSTGVTTGWQDAADYDIGDNIPFQLTGKLPANYDKYKTYKYQFNDTPSAGLTYNDDAKVYVDNGPGKRTEITSSFTTNESNGVITFTCNDLKAIEGAGITKDSSIVVEYTAKLNDQAVIGSAGNPNKVSLTYSNNPNYTGEGANSPTGDTPEDKVIVFTYQTIVNKVDQSGKELKGAAFTLQKKVKKTDGTTEWQDVKTIEAGETTTFTFAGLDDGDYKLIESATPSGYNTIAPIEFSITADFDNNSDDPKLNTLNGVVSSGVVTFTQDTEKGSVTTDVVNKSGSILPSTGGMGTTVLYVGGAVLAVVACVGLAIRHNKRQNA